MEKGYYAPEMDEFCVGFLYEYQHSKDPELWHLMSFSEDCLRFKHLNPYQNLTRVKCLDGDDIEELGYKYVVDSYAGYYTDGKIKIAWWYNKKGIEISELGGDFGGKHLFCGSPRNKTELSRILKIIGTP